MSLTQQQLDVLTWLKQAYGGEAIWRPSSASRWMGPTACYGSIQMIARAPKDRTSSDAAKEGTAAHAVGQASLTGGPQPDEWVGRDIIIDEKTREAHYVDGDMGRHMQNYVDVVDYRTTSGAVRYVEHRLSLAAADPSNPMLAECRGTADIALVHFVERWIEIIDLKYGKGVTVSKKSLQLRVYLLMALVTFLDGQPWKKGRTIVFQPRASGDPDLAEDDDAFDPNRPKEAVFDPAEILTVFLPDVIAAMTAALAPDPPLNPTKDNCRWCPAGNANACPALRALGGFAAFEKSVMGALPMLSLDMPMPPIPEQVVLSNGHIPAPEANTVVLRSPLEMEAQEIARILNIYEDRFKPWIAGVQHRAAQLAEVGVKIEDANGDGWVLRRRTGNRQFHHDISETRLVRLLGRLGADARDLYTKPTLKSVKQVEDLLPPWGRKLLKELVHRPQGELTLVRKTESTVEVAVPPVLGSIALAELDENNETHENNERP